MVMRYVWQYLKNYVFYVKAGLRVLLKGIDLDEL